MTPELSPVNSLTLDDDALNLVHKKLSKYETLVWYARKHPADHPSWDKVPEHIRKGALDSAARVQELYADETDRLSCPEHGDWEHGFNSGVLAALRYVLSVAKNPEDAEFMWPELDT